jgi:hypothetical protein
VRLTTSNFIFQLNACGYSPYVTSTLTRGWVFRLQLLLVIASIVILRSEFRGTHDHILLSEIQDSPNLQVQVPIFISPRNRVAWLYTQALGSLFVASYDSQGYGGSIWPCLHTGLTSHTNFPITSFIRKVLGLWEQWDHDNSGIVTIVGLLLEYERETQTIFLLLLGYKGGKPELSHTVAIIQDETESIFCHC